jgi:hypothetical protein
MGLHRRISWQEAEALLDASERDSVSWEPPQEQTALEWLIKYGNALPPKRQASLMNWFSFELHGHSIRDFDYMGGANPRECFLLELEDDNRGDDHKGLAMRSREVLRRDLKVLRALPNTRWKAERVKATLAELERRRTQ